MRRVLLTSLLAITALGAAFIAPRPQGVFERVHHALTVAPVEESEAHEIHTVGEPEPTIPELDERIPPVRPTPVTVTPPAPPEPPPLPETFWDDCPACGMG